MGLTTAINWADATWNPWQGCDKVSAECAHCYMFRDKARYGQDPGQVVRSAPPTFNLPLGRFGPGGKGPIGAWKIPDGSRIFTCSWSDWFHQDADAWRPEAWDVIRRRPGATFLVLTKRADRIAAHLPPDWGDGWANVWLGVTAGAQASTWRLEALAEVPARVRFVSAEPLVERVDFGPRLAAFHWLIIGGESGPGSRIMAPAWARYARDQGRHHGLAVHLKQWGEWAPMDALDAENQAIARRYARTTATMAGRWAQEAAEAEARGDARYADRARHLGARDQVRAQDYHRVLEDGTEVYRLGVDRTGRLLDGELLAELPAVAA